VILDLLTLFALVACAAGLGVAVLVAVRLPRDDPWEFLALSLAAGLGLLAVLLGFLGLFGALNLARWLVPIGAAFAMLSLARHWRSHSRFPAGRPSLATLAAGAVLASVLAGGALPIIDSDSLAYPVPIAEQLARQGDWQFWPHLARSVYPLSQQFLLAALIDSGSELLGLLTSLEFILSAALVALLARRVVGRAGAGWVAGIIALGSPSAVFLIGSGKEDLLAIAMTVAGALALNLRPGMSAAAAAGLFAGFAAGAKYSGLPIAIGIVACVPFCCGRERRASSLALAALMAAAAGGLWYGVNLVRFGNPVVPMMPSLGHFPVSEEIAAEWLGGYGAGRAPLDFVLAPFRMVRDVLTFDTGDFGGRGN